MKGIDPIWITVIATVVAIDHWIGSGKVDLHHVFPDAWIPWIVGWAGFLGGFLDFVVGALTTIISSKPGILISTPPAAAKPLAIIAIVLGGLFALPSPVYAQTRLRPLTGDVAKDIGLKPVTTGGTSTAATATDQAMGSFGAQVRKITKEIVDKAIADVQAASDDAAKHNDTIAKPCWDANLALLKGLPSQWETPPADIGLALGIQIQRDLLNSITGNDASSLKVACAPLWGDQLQIVANVGALLGIKIATGGLAF
jgi:hypothetical protein